MKPPFGINPETALSTHPIADLGECLVADNFVDDPHLLRAFAKHYRSRFVELDENTYPGPEYALPQEFAAPIAEWWRTVGGPFFGVGRKGCVIKPRFSIAVRQAEELSFYQRIPHLDAPPREPNQLCRIYGAVLYLFEDRDLGGTAFFEAKPGLDLRQLHRDAQGLTREQMVEKYPFFARRPQYPIGDSDFFRKLTEVEARFNRCIFFPSDIFHATNIKKPERLQDSLTNGRLTLNLFIHDLD